jgi:hypothetical protein
MSLETGWRSEIAISQLAMNLSLFRKNRNSLPFASTWVHLQFLVSVQVYKFLSNFQCCVLWFVCVQSVFCAQCCSYLWIVHSLLFLWVSLSFIYIIYVFDDPTGFLVLFYFFKLKYRIAVFLLLLGVNLDLHKIYASTFWKKKRKNIKTYT